MKCTNWQELDLSQVEKKLKEGAILRCESSGGDSKVLNMSKGEKCIAWISCPHIDGGLRWLNIALSRKIPCKEMFWGEDEEWSDIKEHDPEYFRYNSEIDRLIHGSRLIIRYTSEGFQIKPGDDPIIIGQTLNEALNKAENYLPGPRSWIKPLSEFPEWIS